MAGHLFAIVGSGLLVAGAWGSAWLLPALMLHGAVLFLPFQYIRDFHFAHHRHTQGPAGDPELIRPKAESLSEYLLVPSGWPYWGKQAQVLARLADQAGAPSIAPGASSPPGRSVGRRWQGSDWPPGRQSNG